MTSDTIVPIIGDGAHLGLGEYYIREEIAAHVIVHKSRKLTIVNLYEKLKTDNPNISGRDATAQLSKQTGIGSYSVKKTLLEYKRTGEVSSPTNKKCRPSFREKIKDTDKNAIRKKVHSFYINREPPTFGKVFNAVNEDKNLPKFKRTTFYKLLKELHFSFTTRYRNNVLRETEDLIVWRRNYLRAINRFREEGRPIYYLGETWVDAEDIETIIWQETVVKSEMDCGTWNYDTVLMSIEVEERDESKNSVFLGRLSPKPPKPCEKGKGWFVLHIGSAAGFVPDGLLCLESKKNTSNHHGKIDDDTFLQWFEKVLPSLGDNAVIVMDNARCNSLRFEELPNTSWEKGQIIDWLQNKGNAVDQTMVKAELLRTVTIHKEEFDKYIVDGTVKETNKTVLRLPPYHCELNPIERVWPMVKEHMKSYSTILETQDVEKLLRERVNRVTPENWSDFIGIVIHKEKQLWEIDEIADEMTDKAESSMINVKGETISGTDDSDY